MLNLRQMDSIVQDNLLVIKGFKIERREEGTNIFYDVYDNPESRKRFLGTYRVWEWYDGSGRSGWMPIDLNDPEIERIRQMVWDAIVAIAVPANQSTESGAAQPESVDQGKPTVSEVRERMKKLTEISLRNPLGINQTAFVRDANALVKILNSPEDEFIRLLETIDTDSVNKGTAQIGSEKPKQKRGAQLETEYSLSRLREIRLDAIKNNRSIPTKAAAMDEAGITDKTWKKYDPELWARWDDKSYK